MFSMVECFIDKLFSKRCITLEVCPPCSPSLDGVVDALRGSGVLEKIDAFVTTDSPLARMKHDSILASIFLQNSLQKPSIATLSMRDRNVISLQSTLIGANNFDVRSILALTGDGIRLGDHKEAKSVYEGTSALLMKIIDALNENKKINGKDINGKMRTIYGFGVCNSYAKNMNNVKRKMRKKLENGAKAIFTQPVYDRENAKILVEDFSTLKEELNIKDASLMLGFFPITSFKTANFLSSNLPGLYVPQNLVDELYHASIKGRDEEFKRGFDISKNLFDSLGSVHNKFHIMSTNDFKTVNDILK